MISVESHLSGRTVTSEIVVSEDLKRFFHGFEFYVSYDVDVLDNVSILNIPAVATIMPLAWITGSDVSVDVLDATFGDSLEALQNAYKQVYPSAPFGGRLRVKERVKNEDSSQGTALLFSGGLDATFSLYSNAERKPLLAMVLGTDMSHDQQDYQQRVMGEYRAFAEREDLKIAFIHTNTRDIWNLREVHEVYKQYRGRNESDLWNGMGYALGHIALTAPLSAQRFSNLIIAASYDEENCDSVNNPDASSPHTDQLIKWSKLSVEHDGCYQRHTKIAKIKDHLLDGKIKLRVCGWSVLVPNHSASLNCSKCEKCLRTIAALVYQHIDPHCCGFEVDHSTFELMRSMLEGRLLSRWKLATWWEPFQNVSTQHLEHDIHGSKEFFKWFSSVDLDTLVIPELKGLRQIYQCLPAPLRYVIRKINNVVGIGRPDYRHVQRHIDMSRQQSTEDSK